MKGRTGTLYVVATPIGNLEDITARAIRVLRETPVLACEDTRHTGIMLKRLGILHGDRRFVAYYDANEARQTQGLLEILLNGEDVALVTNAGTPLVSDPGYRLVAAAREAGVKVVPVPGPCAAIAALSVCGLPSERFAFYGFLPQKPGKRRKVLEAALAPDAGTAIFYVPARLILKVLQEMGEVCPLARVFIAREMTKVYEEFITGTPAECCQVLGSRTLKGEVTVVASPRAG